ncbi:MAG: type II secretion system F family protein [bacterium]
MPKYKYNAVSLSGETKSGNLDARDEADLARLLKQEGHILISAESEDDANKKHNIFNIQILSRVSLAEKMMITRNLQVMVKAGISLPRALSILSMQSRNNALKDALKDIGDEISRGQSFFSALSKYPQYFSPLFVNMIRVGEESGTLDEVLSNLTHQMDRENDLRSKIIGALIYPIVVISAMLGIGVIMLIVVVPKLSETFKELNVPLPASTQAIVAVGTFLANQWYLALILIVTVVIIIRQALKTKNGKKIGDALILKMPIVSNIVSGTNAAYFTRTLGSLISAGVPIVESLHIISGAMGNIHFETAIIETADKVSKGIRLSDSMQPYQVFPIMVRQMIEVGEETGQTSDILGKLADYYEEEVINYTKNLSALIEPLLMLIVGGVVGFFAISMVQPMYSILQNV